MTEVAEFCPYPADLENCRQWLVQGWQKDSLDEHCIFEGLRANWRQCRQVLLEGLRNRSLQRKDTANKEGGAAVPDKDYRDACGQVVAFGYPMDIKALLEVFYEAHYQLVRSVIYRFGITDDHVPSADEVFRNVFAELSKYFRRGDSLKEKLARHLENITVNTCLEAIYSDWKRKSLTYEDKLEEEKTTAPAFMPPQVVEYWKQLDNQLLQSSQGDLINRIILTLQCLEVCNSDNRLNARQLRSNWQTFPEISDKEFGYLHKKTAVQISRFASKGVIPIVADLANSGDLIAPRQVPIVFAASTGMDSVQIRKLLNKLRNLSTTDIQTRLCRIYMVLQPPKTEEE